MRKIICILTALLLTASLFGCNGNTADKDGASAVSSALKDPVRQDDGKPVGYQLEKPANGEEVAVLITDMGVIRIRLFPEAAPKAVENFKGLIGKWYYNGNEFHRVINDFMIQGGDPTGTGTGGESIWKEPFEDEFNKNLLNIRGAVSMANAGPNTNGSQFFINQARPETFPGWDYYQKGYDLYQQDPNGFIQQYGSWMDVSQMSEEVKNLYVQCGGNPTLDGAYSLTGRGHTVFGQVYEGMDVVDKISAVEVEPGNNRPVEKVKIVKAEIQTYKAT